MLLNQILSHEMQLRDMAGGRLHFTIRELRDIFLTPVAGVFVALAILVHFSADPPGLRDFLSVWVAFLIWPIVAVLYLTTYFIWLGAVAMLQLRGWAGPAYLPIIGALTLAPCVCASEVMVHQMSGGTYPITILPKIAYYFMTVQVFEFAFIRLVIPRALEKQAALRLLKVGDRAIPVARLRFMVAQEHYVRLVLDNDEQVLERARFGDLLDQLRDSDGIRAHRSWWAARSAAPRLTRQGARHLLRLHDGTEVPVARSRVGEVQAWMDRNGPVAASLAEWRGG